MTAPFNDITPPEGLHQESETGGCFDIAGFRGVLYVAELVHDETLARDRYRFLGYDFAEARWDTLASIEVQGEGEAPRAAAPSVRFLALREPGASEEVLFVRSASPLGVRLLRLGEGGRFSPLAEESPLIEACFGFIGLAELDGRLFGLGQDEDGRPARIAGFRPESGTWEPADLPPFADGSRRAVSEITTFEGALYAATVDGERGCELWRRDLAEADPDWKPVFERGAWRYAQNREAFAMVRQGDALHLVAGTREAERRPESKFLDYQGFEVIRVAADGTWDLLVGVPRFSPNGLVVPFSGLGAGMHPSLGLEYRACLSHGGRLLLGLHGINGFQLWASADGEAWSPLPHPELAAIHRVDACRAIPTGEHLALLLATTDALGNPATRVSAGRPGEAVGG